MELNNSYSSKQFSLIVLKLILPYDVIMSSILAVQTGINMCLVDLNSEVF